MQKGYTVNEHDELIKWAMSDDHPTFEDQLNALLFLSRAVDMGEFHSELLDERKAQMVSDNARTREKLASWQENARRLSDLVAASRHVLGKSVMYVANLAELKAKRAELKAIRTAARAAGYNPLTTDGKYLSLVKWIKGERGEK
jgi:hypothetical protein